jgi:hypothetical protein
VEIVSSALLAFDASDEYLNWRTSGNLANPHSVCFAVVLDMNRLLEVPTTTSRIPRLRVVIFQCGRRRAAEPE